MNWIYNPEYTEDGELKKHLDSIHTVTASSRTGSVVLPTEKLRTKSTSDSSHLKQEKHFK